MAAANSPVMPAMSAGTGELQRRLHAGPTGTDDDDIEATTRDRGRANGGSFHHSLHST